MRALEVGRYSIRSTNTGISAFIGPTGEILKIGEQFKSVVMTASVRTHRGTTIYADSGNWTILGICYLILGFFWIRSRAGA